MLRHENRTVKNIVFSLGSVHSLLILAAFCLIALRFGLQSLYVALKIRIYIGVVWYQIIDIDEI